ncbi:MAG: dTDP-4-dehydrorhamnose reductase [Lachnospiraceae bacterium]|nr:dTDP-4-dehydrorhamnose reductase [Lachnospiraceae bacterium]
MKKKILITGALGQLGRAVKKEFEGEADFVLTDMVESDGVKALDISDMELLNRAFDEEGPDCVINCAAFTNVDGCEKEEDKAFIANAIGPRNLAIVSEKYGAKLIHISTDYVFSGNSDHPLIETDEPSPVSAYGRTKLAGERFVEWFSTRFFILRTAWLYGEGKNFVRTMLSLSTNHDEVSVVSDQLGTPTSAKELARMIHFLEPTENYGLFHATCEGDTNWADFTEEIFRQKGIKTKVNHVTSEEYKRMNPASADRPHYSILEDRMIKLTSDFRMKEWKEALSDYLSTEGQ